MRTDFTYRAGLYCRLSKDDEQRKESVSITTQRSMLISFCKDSGYEVSDIYIDDGFSGLNFERPGFQRLLIDIQAGKINLVITKDLSRLGRDYIMTGYYSEIFFPSRRVRYIAVDDDYDSARAENDTAPFRNILNEMYARDISRKVKSAKRQQARDGKHIGSQAPYGFIKKGSQLTIDPDTCDIVRLIYELSANGLGNQRICKELATRKILSPSEYKLSHGDTRFMRFCSPDNPYNWRTATIQKILTDPVYQGTLVSLKTDTINYKTKWKIATPIENRIITANAHQRIISEGLYNSVVEERKLHHCPAYYKRENIFRGLLYCSCCGHPLSIAHRKLVGREDDLYRCMQHYYHPEVCPETHAIYHSELYPYILKKVRMFIKMNFKQKKQEGVIQCKRISVLTPEIMNQVINRIEIDHISDRVKSKNTIQIYWKAR